MSNVVSHRTGHPRLRIDFRGADAECVSGASTEGSGRAVQPVPAATSRRRSPGYRPMQLSRCVNAPEAPSTDAIAIRPSEPWSLLLFCLSHNALVGRAPSSDGSRAGAKNLTANVRQFTLIHPGAGDNRAWGESPLSLGRSTLDDFARERCSPSRPLTLF